MGLISWVSLSIITIINIVGWVYTKVHTYGKLEQKVKDLDSTINNGLVDKVGELSNHVSKLEGTISTYINITKDR